MLSSLTIHPIILIVVGILLALFGYKIQKLVLTLACFLLGYTVATAICPYFTTDSVITIIAGVVGGLLLASLGLKIEKLAVASTVAYLVYTSLTTYAGMIPVELTDVIKVIISFVCGIGSLLLIRPVLILATSIAGSSILLNGLSTYITIPSNIYLIVLIIVILLTALVQFKTTKR